MSIKKDIHPLFFDYFDRFPYCSSTISNGNKTKGYASYIRTQFRRGYKRKTTLFFLPKIEDSLILKVPYSAGFQGLKGRECMRENKMAKMLSIISSTYYRI